jgi:hypothetical protein
MIVFGLLNPLDVPTQLRDARVLLVGFTLATMAVALALSGAPRARKARIAQFLVVLPWGALPLVTGGDDMPVLALTLLGLVFAARRQPVAAGLVIGVAATLKFTAWPILLLTAFAARDRDGARVPLRYGLAALAVVVPVVAIGFAPSPHAFIENVIRFPLGLTTVRSPAASPLLGQALTSLLPGDRQAITAALVALGAVIIIAVGVRRPPSRPSDVAWFTAFALLVATVLAPASRFGYLIYPANLAVFGYLLAAVEPARRVMVQFSSSTSKMRSSTVLEAVSASPASAGVMEGFAGSTTTPTSQ